VCCQIEVSATGWSLVQRSPTDCGVSECDREASIMKRLWPTRGCCAMGEGGNERASYYKTSSQITQYVGYMNTDHINQSRTPSFTSSSPMRNSQISELGLLFFRFRNMYLFRTEVFSPSPNPQTGGPGLPIYDPRRQGGSVIPIGTGWLGTSEAPLPVLTTTINP
jgi:hypothetical protein